MWSPGFEYESADQPVVVKQDWWLVVSDTARIEQYKRSQFGQLAAVLIFNKDLSEVLIFNKDLEQGL